MYTINHNRTFFVLLALLLSLSLSVWAESPSSSSSTRSKPNPSNLTLSNLTLSNLTSSNSSAPSPDQVKSAMKMASQFMVEKVSYHGGYVWSYLPDFSRQWGELEARRTMIWMQPPGTATMGHVFLDAYHATGDEYYYQAAEQVAGAIIWAQHPSGGWNYLADFAGEASLKDWYITVGKTAWRLEEFQHYYGNATFDDGGTADASKFLLRLYAEKWDPKYRPALEKAIDFMLASQYPNGGWPQRYPLMFDFPEKDHPDYTSFITFNDDVAAENIEFLLMCYSTLGEQRVREPVLRAMGAFLITQMGSPQPGWALQYTTDLEPAGARSYEPASLSPPTTAENISLLIRFYQATGDSKYLARIPEALTWLDKVALPSKLVRDGRTHPGFVEWQTGRVLYTHRRGSNVANGEYYVNDQPGQGLAHYSSTKRIDVKALQAEYQQALTWDAKQLRAQSPLFGKGRYPLPDFYTRDHLSQSDLNFRAQQQADKTGQLSLTDRARLLVKGLNNQGYWPTPLYYTTNPYKGYPPSTPAQGDYSGTMVGDEWDTSPYPAKQPKIGISTGAYIKNMATLIAYLDSQKH